MKKKQSKRSQGRPWASGVGRESVLATAKRLLQELPPARVTLSLIAREAGIDPALIRYYFGDRTNLLLAVVDSTIGEAPAELHPTGDALEALRQHIRSILPFTRSAKNMHRLMIDELAEAKSAAARSRQRAMNMRTIDAFKDLFARDAGAMLRAANPLFLHLALIGMFDFFVAAEPIIRNLVPPETDMEQLTHEFEEFVVDLVLNGMRRRGAD